LTVNTLNLIPKSQIDPSLALFEKLGVFADWKLPSDEEIRFVSEGLGFQIIVIGVGTNGIDGWNPTYKAEKIIERVEACSQAGLETIVMPWAIRKEDSINQMCDWLLEHFKTSTPILFDAEEPWYRGTINQHKAAEIIAEALSDRIWGVTSVPKMSLSVEPLAKLASILIPFGYAVWNPESKSHWSHSKSSFPGVLQDVAAINWKPKNPEARFIMGLANYWGARPATGKTPALSASHTMRFSCIETIALGIYEACFWALKWFLEDSDRGKEVRSFFGFID
jgi:hypothetical protein